MGQFRNVTIFTLPLFFAFIGPALNAEQQASAPEQPYYTVKLSDTVTGILYKLGLVPIYGPNQFLERTLKLNLDLVSNNANVVHPGYVLKLPISKGYFSSRMRMLENGEVIETDAQLVSEAQNQERNIASKETSETHALDDATAGAKSANSISRLAFGVSSGFHGVTGEDSSNNTTGELSSKLSGGIFFDWHQLWSEQFETSTGFEAKEVSIQNTDDDKELKNRTNVLSEFNYSALYRLSNDTSFGAKVGISDMILYQGLGGGVYKVDVVNRLAFGFLVRQQILKNGPLSLSASGETGTYRLRADAPYKQSEGSYYSFGLNTTYLKGRWGLVSELNYAVSYMDIQTVSYQQESFNLNLGIIWSWTE